MTEPYLALLAEGDALASELAALRDGVVPVPIMDAIEARADAATPGPWADVCMGSEGYFILESEPSTGTKRRRRVSMCIHEAWEIDKANAEFIAHAREDVPALVAEVRRLASELAAARGGTCRGWSWDDVERHVSRLVIERDHAEAERDAARAETDRQSEGREVEQGMLRAAVSRLVRIADVLGVEEGLDDPESIEARITHIAAECDAARREAGQARAELAALRVELERTEGDWAVAIREASRVRAALARVEERMPFVLAPIGVIRHAMPCSMRKAIYDGARCDCDVIELRRRAVEAEIRAALSVAATDTEEAP